VDTDWYDTPIVAKHAMPKESQSLAREAMFYKERLAHLRGAVVPEFLVSIALMVSPCWSSRTLVRGYERS
jgi:hypothetical protein